MPVIDVELLPRPISASISLSLISFCSATINFVLVLRYLELEDEHEALFPALASAFKLTQQEVQRIQHQQQSSPTCDKADRC